MKNNLKEQVVKFAIAWFRAGEQVKKKGIMALPEYSKSIMELGKAVQNLIKEEEVDVGND